MGAKLHELECAQPAGTTGHLLPGQGRHHPGAEAHLLQYAGQQVLTGAQASAYAQKIESDVVGMPYGGVYTKISAAALANPNNAALKAEATTAFEGTTLGGLLLEAYAFGTFGTIALWAGISAFILAGLMLILVLFGFWHSRRVPDHVEILAPAAK